jgi:hypothetical protein
LRDPPTGSDVGVSRNFRPSLSYSIRTYPSAFDKFRAISRLIADPPDGVIVT